MNLVEVAKRARVSTATVSRVLNNSDMVKSSTRTRVTKAIEELKFYPNLHARSLAGGKSRTIGVIVSNLDNPFFLDIYKAIEADVHTRGYEILLADTGYRSQQLVASIHLMIGRRVAGLAALVSEMEPALIDELEESRIPVVFYDVGTPKRNITNIRVNYRRGVERVVDYLHGMGHRRIGFIGHHSSLGPISERLQAVQEAMAQYSLPLVAQSMAESDTFEGGRMAARAMLNLGANPTAIICVNDVTAVGALRELRERGIHVPQDISVTGFDNIKPSEFCYPALTTVHIPREQIGHIVCQRLLPLPGQPEAAELEMVIDPEFVLRDSTGPAPA